MEQKMLEESAARVMAAVEKAEAAIAVQRQIVFHNDMTVVELNAARMYVDNARVAVESGVDTGQILFDLVATLPKVSQRNFWITHRELRERWLSCHYLFSEVVSAYAAILGIARHLRSLTQARCRESSEALERFYAEK